MLVLAVVIPLIYGAVAGAVFGYSIGTYPRGFTLSKLDIIDLGVACLFWPLLLVFGCKLF